LDAFPFVILFFLIQIAVALVAHLVSVVKAVVAVELVVVVSGEVVVVVSGVASRAKLPVLRSLNVGYKPLVDGAVLASGLGLGVVGVGGVGVGVHRSSYQELLFLFYTFQSITQKDFNFLGFQFFGFQFLFKNKIEMFFWLSWNVYS
jgi:hypothetical protein